MRTLRVGVDVGGTFTDAFLVDEVSGALHLVKVPSVPADPSLGVASAISKLLQQTGHQSGELGFLVHGTTLGINTLIQRNGTPTGLMVTAGFGDMLELGRGRLPAIHDFNVRNVPALVSRDMVVELNERVLASGDIFKELDPAEVEEKARHLVRCGARAVAVCLLHAYRNPSHELRVAERLRELLPDIYVCLSHAVWPQAREYERAMATVINAYIGDPVASYYRRLQQRLAELGVEAPIYVTRSAGGMMSLDSAQASPIQTILSGPAAGVAGAAHLAARSGEHRVICLDMGGTTADVSVVDEAPKSSYETVAAGFTLSIPSIDVVAIGAGGGSVAWVDPSGVLKVGPQSAGADPGPAAYGRGGEDATVTDAYIVLGYVDPQRFLGGQMPLDAELAFSAIKRLGVATGEEATAVAAQILEVASSNMYAELVPLLRRQGIEPGEFALFAYGGAGPTQAFFLAEEVGMTKVVVPPHPGGMCALGGLLSDFKSDFVKTVYWVAGSFGRQELEASFAEIEAAANRWLVGEGVHFAASRIARSADMRYVGQSFEINVPLDDLEPSEVAAAFHGLHEVINGHSDVAMPFEIMSIRVQAVGALPALKESKVGTGAHTGMPSRKRSAWFRGGWRTVDVFERAQLLLGATIHGPTVIEQYDTTVVVPPGWQVQCDEQGNLVGTAGSSS